MPPLKRKKAFAWITVSAVALTGTGAFAQLGIRETSIVFSLFVRFALAALILLVMAPLERLRSLRTIPTVQWLRVGFVMCSQSALFVYLAEGTLLNGMLLYNTGPLFTPLLAWMLWRKTIRATGIVSIVLGFVGVALVLDPTRSALDGMLLVGLASGFFNSCSQLSLYAGGKGGVALSETDNLFQFFTLCAAASLVALLFRPADLTIGVHRLGESAILASFVALSACGVVNQYARSVAYRNIRNPANLGPFLYLSIVLSALVDWAAYDIVPSRVTLLGGVFIAASAVVVSWRAFHGAVSQAEAEVTR
jgi:drug/metabolite transporter (DMT)-like permease